MYLMNQRDLKTLILTSLEDQLYLEHKLNNYNMNAEIHVDQVLTGKQEFKKNDKK